MELRAYWNIFWRRAWIAIGLAMLVVGLSLASAPRIQTTYVAAMRIAAGVPPETPGSPSYFGYNKYYAWVTSEYLVDDLGEVVKSQLFARDVAAELGDPSVNVPAVLQAQRTRRTHRILTIEVSASTPELAERVANAAARVLVQKAPKYLAQLGNDDALLQVVDPPTVRPEVTGVRSYLEIGLRAALGFLVGLGLIFLLEYLDTSIRDAREAEQFLGVPVLGEIPRGS